MKGYGYAPRCARALMCSIALMCKPLSSPALAAEAPETANACVGFQKEDGDKLLIFHASNACDRQLSCRLDYTLRCEDNQRKVTSRAAKSQPFRLGPKDTQDVTLSATSCKQGWAIDDVAWTCF